MILIFVGRLKELAAEYQKTWSGLCRGNPRSAYTTGAEGLILRSDFFRWLGRRAIKNKEAKMILVERIERNDQLVLVFKGNDKGKTVEQLVAEVICELGRDGKPVSSWAIHFAALHHPFSTTQRLRELKDNFFSFSKMVNMPALDTLWAYRFIKDENAYYFSREFIFWLNKFIAYREPGNVPAH